MERSTESTELSDERREQEDDLDARVGSFMVVLMVPAECQRLEETVVLEALVVVIRVAVVVVVSNDTMMRVATRERMVSLGVVRLHYHAAGAFKQCLTTSHSLSMPPFTSSLDLIPFIAKRTGLRASL
jgi:hypothetical protein